MIRNRYARKLETPIGSLVLVADDNHLLEVRFPSAAESAVDGASSHSPILEAASNQLREYFAGTLQAFDLPWTVNGTPFQNRVWTELCTIPFGVTCSYAELAQRVGSPKGARAVGLAVGRNPLPILIPCHRVIGSDGSLVGFGGGLDIKRRLLELESHAVPA